VRYGIINLAQIPVRKEMSDKSEMINQLLFGELISISHQEKQWVKITHEYDGYEGWIDEKQFLEIDNANFRLLKQSTNVCNSLFASASFKNQIINFITGSTIHNYSKKRFSILDTIYETEAIILDSNNNKPNDKNIISTSLKYLNTPYLWGGRSILGIDCSGFTQMVFKHFNIPLKRDAYQQAEQGRQVDFLDNSQAGDLAFFSNKEGKIIHVGIILNDKKIIHASGFVRIDTIDHHGIYNQEKKSYSHNLRFIKRII
jgi:hypothetical protein